MVKPDPSRKYYKELEVSETADVLEIKRQYKKLAFKYHPDRNANNIEEATKNFQIIGEALEVLSDPELRAKYDAMLAKNRYAQASGVHGNPWQDVGKEFPPPPRRTNMPNRHPTAKEKYRNMFAGASSSNTAPESPEDNASAFHAFQRMRAGRRKPGPAPSSSSPPKSASAAGASRPPPETPPRAPRTEAQRERANAAFGNRRQAARGYQPHSPAATDEPPVASSNYFSTTRHTSLFEDAATNLRREREQAPEQQQPSTGSSAGASREKAGEDRANDSFSARQRRAYASSSGERLDLRAGMPGTPDLGRTRSTREPQRGDPSPPPRQRSASVPNAEETPGFAQPNKPPPGYNTTSNGSATELGDQQAPPPSTTSRPTNFSTATSTNNTAAGAADGTNRSSTSNDQSSTAQNGNPPLFSFKVNDGMLNPDVPPKQPFPNASSESVNTTFSRTGSEESWNFTANDGTGAGAPKHRASPSGRPGRRSPLKKSRSNLSSEASGWHSFSQEQPQPQAPRAEGARPPSSATKQPSFDPSEWRDKIDPNIFEPPPAPTSSGSPTRGRSGTTKKSKSRQPFVEDASPSPRPEGSFAPPGETSDNDGAANADSPMAMDIDSPPANEKSGGVRNIPVEPSRPDWRAGNPSGSATNGGSVGAAATPSKPPPASQPIRKPADGSGAGKPPLGSKSNPIPVGGSEDMDEFCASFADLRKTEPFQHPKPTGMDSFSDMKTTLPFQSRASTNIHLDREVKINTPPPNLHAPPPPMLPHALANLPPPVAGTIPSEEARATVDKQWKGFLASTTSYLEEYTRWDRQIARYLDQVQSEMADRRITGQGFGWLDIGRDDAVMATYGLMLQQTQHVRSAWAQEGAKHAAIMREVQAVREGVRQILERG